MLEKTYAPAQVEAHWAQAWRASRAFHADASAPGEPYVVVIPPPNVTGALHIGHALNNTLQDILVRWHRLRGRAVCWVPGTDHGGIATQSVMEKQLKAEGLTRQDLGREAFLERMQAWTRQCKSTILGQLERLGCALDWEREAFTMDEARADAVYEAFEVLWKAGLIKRGERMVNWCVRCGTALSDIEVEHEDRKGHLWHMRYPGADGSPGIVVATTRPETMLGDTAVAVNPRDTRYDKLVGKTLRLPLMDRPIPVVGDDSVDFAFGTGAVKVTPAHDPNDFEIGQRHKLPSIKVIGPDGRMTSAAGAYAGLSRELARDKVLKDLGELLIKAEDHPHAVGVCYRCGQVVEPLLSWQWFVEMKLLADKAREALKRGAFRIFPESWEKPYGEWLKGIKDWCVSRQIWWGHRIPVWYCLNCNRDLFAAAPKEPGASPGDWGVHQIPGAKPTVSRAKPDKCDKCGGRDFVQDPDVLDTWFSSALWPFSVFGWPKETADSKHFYPTHVLVTGYEILYLWVARMQMMGLQLLGKAPFPHALIHGIVRDKHGKKMSKSLGNVIDPLVMMDKYGTDAFRFSLSVQAHPGRDIPFAEESITGSRNFVNKLWNSTRFVLMNLPEVPPAGGYPHVEVHEDLRQEGFELADYWILREYWRTRRSVADKLETYEIAAAADDLYTFLWDKFCDWYIELAKIRLNGPDGREKEAARMILVRVLNGMLKLLHPFMPFVTEELFQALKPFSGEEAASIAGSALIERREGLIYESIRYFKRAPDVSQMDFVMQAITAIRMTRSQLNVPPGLKVRALFDSTEALKREVISQRGDYIKFLARIEELIPYHGSERPPTAATAVAPGCTFYLPLEGVIDFKKEKLRLTKEVADLDGQLKGLEVRLSNPSFVQRAPKDEVEKVRSLRDEHLAKRVRLQETIQSLG